MFLIENYKRLNVSFTRGERVYLYDDKGNRYLDLLAGIAVNALGYNYPGFNETLKKQVSRLIHVSNLFENPWQEEVARKLVNRFWDKNAKVFFCNSGTEANEAAIKLVRKFFRDRQENRYRIITFRSGFHGRTYGSLSATAQTQLHEGVEPMLEGFDYATLNDISSVEALLRDETAGIMLEVIQGEGGIRECELQFLSKLQEVCEREGLLLIVDEVQTGVGRTGRFYGYEHYGIKPHVITLAKGLGGGVPIGAVVAVEHVAKAFTPGSHGSTFGGNPLACAAASFVIDEVGKLLPQIREVGEYFKKGLTQLNAGQVRGKGLMLGLDIGRSCNEIVPRALKEGLVLNCTAKSVLRFLPPLILEKEHVDEALRLLKRVI